ncbi:TVP38/TMEM64 family protein [Candidatus Woesearchaeota archaeon]|nr:TVP38/TMEM64 family protein [Candidatus Woesearchaeota archaeon]
MDKKKIWLVAVVLVLILCFFLFDLGRFFSLEQLKELRGTLQEQYAADVILFILVFFLIYAAMAALSLPGATIMTLAAGAIFGLVLGTIIVSFASSIGALLAMLFSRYIFRTGVQKKFSKQFEKLHAQVEKEGAFYLFTLRLIPLFPFFVINLLMGLTRMKAWTFYWVSQIGMFLGTIVYVNAGAQLIKISSLSEILSPGLLFSFVLIGIFPLFAKRLVGFLRKRQHN